MNKNLIRTGIGLAIGGSLLFTSTVMSMADKPSGYEVLKSVFKDSERIQNATYQISATLSDNNTKLIKMNAQLKSEEENLFSGTVELDTENKDKSYVLYGQKDSMVFKDDDSTIYNKIEERQKTGKKNRGEKVKLHKEDPKLEKLGEMILDTLVGDLKYKVDLTELDDGYKKLTVDLEENEIPALVNLALAIKEEDYCDKDNKFNDKDCCFSDILDLDKEDFQFPKITDNIKAEKIYLDLTLDKSNMIKELNMEFDITGNDAKGEFHKNEMDISLAVDDINSTVVDTIDLKDKEVKIISQDKLDKIQ